MCGKHGLIGDLDADASLHDGVLVGAGLKLGNRNVLALCDLDRITDVSEAGDRNGVSFLTLQSVVDLGIRCSRNHGLHPCGDHVVHDLRIDEITELCKLVHNVYSSSVDS